MSLTSTHPLKRSNPSTIRDKFLVGYQGWFTCAGDGEPVGPGHHGWLHWFTYPIPDGGRPNTDIWPDVSQYSSSELYPAPGLKIRSTNEQAFLFSSRHPKTVQRHFHWMAQVNVDGAFLQRFVGQCDLERGQDGIRRIRDEVGDRVREAAEKEGRVFAIMYDVSGVEADRVQGIIEKDWHHLVHEKGVLDSPNYLKERGKFVIALWGFGFADSGHSPDAVRRITAFLRSATPGGAYIIAGTPAYWRTSSDDADRNPEFLSVWLNEFDMISPWTVGRYRTSQDADDFAATKTKGDIDFINKKNEEDPTRRVDYMPVVLPGGSGYNLSEGKWGYNDIKRNGGKFLWQQIFNVHRLGAKTMYGAMWDEYDEGTALMPVVEKKRNLPHSDKFPFMALDEDGYDLPSDWFMRICGLAAEGLRGERRIHETFPSKELQDYWSTRPKYEHSTTELVANSSASTPQRSSYQEWLDLQKQARDEVPPPPYSLEVEENISPQTSSAVDQSASSIHQPQALHTAPSQQSSSCLDIASVSGAERGVTEPVIQNSANLTQSTARQDEGSPGVNLRSRPSLHAEGSMQSLEDGFRRQHLSDTSSLNPVTNTHPSSPASGLSGRLATSHSPSQALPPPPSHPSRPGLSHSRSGILSQPLSPPPIHPSRMSTNPSPRPSPPPKHHAIPSGQSSLQEVPAPMTTAPTAQEPMRIAAALPQPYPNRSSATSVGSLLPGLSYQSYASWPLPSSEISDPRPSFPGTSNPYSPQDWTGASQSPVQSSQHYFSNAPAGARLPSPHPLAYSTSYSSAFSPNINSSPPVTSFPTPINQSPSYGQHYSPPGMGYPSHHSVNFPSPPVISPPRPSSGQNSYPYAEGGGSFPQNISSASSSPHFWPGASQPSVGFPSGQPYYNCMEYNSFLPDPGPAPPIPSRPINYDPAVNLPAQNNTYSPPPQLPSFAANAIDRVAGRQQREQLENTVGNITQSQ